MNRIEFDITEGAEGQQVADLHDGMQFLLEHGELELTDAARKKLLAGIAEERGHQAYRDLTRRVVQVYQKQKGLEATGNVDERTAYRLNADLERLDAFESGGGPPIVAKPTTAVVAGRVRDESGAGVGGVLVRAFLVRDDLDIDSPVRLGSDRSDADGAYSISYPVVPDGRAVDLQLDAIDDAGRRLARSDVVREAGPLVVVDLVAESSRPVATARLEGLVTLEHGSPADGIELRIYQIGFGGVATEVGRTSTTPAGEFAFNYDRGDASVSLEVRAVSAAGAEVALSRGLTHMGVVGPARIGLVAPSALQPAPAEYTRLTADLAAQVGDLKALATSREDGDRSDLSVLNGATGWDARLIALASTAERLEQQTALPAEGLYGLLRAGLPSDPQMLAQLDEQRVTEVLKNGVAAGVITLQEAAITNFGEQFKTFARDVRLNVPAPGSATTYAELLKDVGVDPVDSSFADAYVSHRGDGPALWDRAREAGVPEPTVRKLQLQGKLAFLAGNSGPVTQSLMQALSGPEPPGGGPAPLKAPAELVQLDLYDAAAWKRHVSGLAANTAELDGLIPLAYQGPSTDVRLDAYAEDMARKVRLAYPTAVIGRMIEKDELSVGTAKAAATAVLDAASAEGFTFGRTPIGAFVDQKAIHPAGLSGAEVAAGTEQLRTLQRVYQVTPSNDAMPVLLKMGYTSAHDISALREDDFYRKFDGAWFDLYNRHPTKAESRLVWRKAQQVSAMTYNLFAVARKLDTDPLVPSISGTPDQVAKAKRDLKQGALKAYPTMESLFGSMDFCECEHCQSVLSPAAYLVDLLQFVEAEPQARANFEADWLARNGTAYATNYAAPYDELTRRRPDLANIPLTCENTNVPLPYIDLVNEILEFYVANGALTIAAANDTGDAESADLLAEPQHVVATAYDTLRADRYPVTVPFDLWLATVRELGRYAEAPLERVNEVLRRTDALFDAGKGDRATTFLEALGITPDERAIYADPDPLAAWWVLYGYGAEAEALPTLRSAKALARRLGVSYKDLVQLVTLRFVNPGIADLRLLRRVGLGITEARIYVDAANQAFLAANRDLLGDALDAAQQARLDALPKADWERLTNLAASDERLKAYATAFGEAEATVRARIGAVPFDRILEIADPDAGCDFDATTLRYADGSDAGGDTFLRLNLFVRLWRTLGWSMTDLDRAIVVLTPANAPFDEANVARRPLLSTLIHLSHLRTLSERVKVGRAGRNALLTLWSDLPTAGRESLYARLFLTPAVLRTDPVFDHPSGDYLAADWVAKQGQGKDPSFVLVRGHLPAIRTAVGLTADDVAAVLTDTGLGADAALSLANVSTLYRYGLLAKGLRLSIGELITLKALSGIDPFAPLAAEPLAQLADDIPFSNTLAFVDVADDVRRSGLSVDELDFLVQRRFDEAGPLRRDRAATLVVLKNLADGVRAIRAAHSLPSDQSAVTEEFLGGKLGLAMAPEVAQRVLRILRGEEPLVGLETFFVDHLRHGQIRDADDTGFLMAADFPALFEPLPAPVAIDPDDDAQAIAEKQAANEQLFAENQAKLQQRRIRVARAFLPVLQDRLIRQLVVQLLASATGAEPVLVDSLGANRRLVEVAQPGGARTLLAMLASGGDPGIDASFFASQAGTGARQDTPPHVAAADTALRPPRSTAGTVLPAPNSARFDGYVVVPATGAYRFFVELETVGAKARLRLPHLPQPLFLDGTATTANAVLGTGAGEFVELKSGVPYRFSLELDSLGAGRGRLLVQGETSPRAGIDQLGLYPAVGMDSAYRAHELLASAVLLLGSLELDEREVGYVLTHRAAWGDVDLGTFPTEPVGDTAIDRAAAVKRFGQVRRLAAYRRLRLDMAGDAHGDLIDVFEADATTDPARLVNAVYPMIGRMTRREPEVVRATAEALWAVPEFGSDVPVARLWDALQLVDRLGAGAPAIQRWTRILEGGTPQPERAEIAREVKDSIKARFDPDTWRAVAQPIFDALRRRQRDALVAHVMHDDGFERQAQVYEQFLLDPGMEPVVQTSRIRLAIASVQLFVQRCLLNLEGRVHPSALINADQWEWMKRYRVWEANRKIFLFPENWLEPEFRDEKSHLFADLEGALLKDDVSADSVEEAFITYLVGLEELARLDIMAMHLETHPDFGANILHVFGRTFAQPYKYFYRQYANDMWTPWEPVGAEVDGDHLVPVVWRERLFLFWVTFLESASPSGGQGPLDLSKAVPLPTLSKSVEAQLHWSEYRDGTWSTSETGGYTQPNDLRLRKDGVPLDFTPQNVFVHVSVVGDPSEEEETVAGMAEAGVYIHLGAPISMAFHLVSRRASPERASYASPPKMPFTVDSSAKRATRYVGKDNLTVTFSQRISTEPGKSHTEPVRVLDAARRFTLLACDNTIGLAVSPEAYEHAERPAAVKAALEASIAEIESLMKPVFFQDATHTLFIEPDVTERTIEEWQEWVTRTPAPSLELPGWLDDKEWWNRWVVPAWPKRPVDPRGPITPPDDWSILVERDPRDWLVNEVTGLLFDGQVIGGTGRVPIEITAPGDVLTAGLTTEIVGGSPVTLAAGSEVAAGAFAVGELDAVSNAGLGAAAAGIILVGGSGFNVAMQDHVANLGTLATTVGSIGLMGPGL